MYRDHGCSVMASWTFQRFDAANDVTHRAQHSTLNVHTFMLGTKTLFGAITCAEFEFHFILAQAVGSCCSQRDRVSSTENFEPDVNKDRGHAFSSPFTTLHSIMRMTCRHLRGAGITDYSHVAVNGSRKTVYRSRRRP